MRDLSQREVYINILAELTYLQGLPAARGGVARGEEVYFAHDLRPSSTRFVGEEDGRGELCQAAEQAILDAGMTPVNLGAVPTPALTWYALSKRRASVMITGSHIPFDLNGYKLNTSVGELLKEHEAPITEQVRITRALPHPLFDGRGMLRDGHRELSPVWGEARAGYIARYLDFFGTPLTGQRILVYQHSAVGRDLLVELLSQLGAEVVVRGRSDTFVAIDTEAIGAEELATIQNFVRDDSLFAAVSTDGDSDRPLILGVDKGQVHFFSGDLVGMIVAQYLKADAVVVPISCNDAIDRSDLAGVLEPKTKIGSPHVIAGMNAAREKSRKRICGWEANGGFLLGSDIDGLSALPTRDAMLPIVATLAAAARKQMSLCRLFGELPKRFSRAALLRPFARETGQRIVDTFRSAHALGVFFTEADGFSEISHVDLTDGVRVYFTSGDVAHFRPSGNADEFRMYAVADSAVRAEKIVRVGLDKIVRRMESAL